MNACWTLLHYVWFDLLVVWRTFAFSHRMMLCLSIPRPWSRFRFSRTLGLVLQQGGEVWSFPALQCLQFLLFSYVFLLFKAQHLWISLVHTTDTSHVPKLDLGVFGYWINWIAPLKALCCSLIWSRSKPLRSKSKLCLVRYRYGLTVGYVHWCANRICSTPASF